MKAIQELQNFTFVSKYARWIKEENRRETWKEAVNRVRQMMLEKYKDFGIEEDILWAYDMMEKKKVLGSQRALNFGGKPILDCNLRIYNCLFSYVDRLRVFQECFFSLLAGCGFGYSIQFHHINKLPQFNSNARSGSEVYTIPDSIEGWADSIGVLLSYYFEPVQPEWEKYTNCKKLKFDYSEIRPAGSYLSSSSGKAPGPEPLKQSHICIQELLDKCIQNNQKKLLPINAHDLICHMSDAVLSGGVRRSSCIALFSSEDEDMINAKTGNWLKENPQRARANNSAVLLRDSTTKDKFLEIFNKSKSYGEPGLVWVDNLEYGTNPCFGKDVRIHTHLGLVRIEELYKRQQLNIVTVDNRVDENGYINGDNGTYQELASQVELTQYNADIYTVETKHGYSIDVTQNHQFPTREGYQPLRDLRVGDTILLQSDEGQFGTFGTYEEGLILGLVTGDGTFCKRDKSAFIQIWEDDFDQLDYIQQIVQSWNMSYTWKTCNIGDGKVGKKRLGGTKLYQYFQNFLKIPNPLDIKKNVPECVWKGTKRFVQGYLQGMIFSDGSVYKTNIKQKQQGVICSISQSNLLLLKELQILLSNFGIMSRLYPVRKKGGMKLLPDNKGQGNKKYYMCKDTHELHINKFNLIRLINRIGLFGRKYDIAIKLLDAQGWQFRNKEYHKTVITKIYFSKRDDVYCLNQPITHSLIANGIVTANCSEIGFYAYDEKTGKSGIQACNLSTINCGTIKDEEDFYERCRAAAILATMQAGFTDFPYLGEITERIVRREALLGVSLTGILDMPEIVLNPKIQRKGVEIIRKTNQELSKKIGINQAARLTCIKPSGTCSALLGTSSGIHPNHAKRYIRHVQANVMEEPLKHFAKYNPEAIVNSVWSSNGTDKNIRFPIEVKDGAKLKNQMSALELLEIVKLTQQNWVTTGTNKSLCTQPWLDNAVSNTIVVQDDEWDNVAEYIYKNRKHFAGIALLSGQGDKIYPQAPFVEVLMSHEIVSKYGDGAIWCSGIIELATQAFGNNKHDSIALWNACDALLNPEFGQHVSNNGSRFLRNMSEKMEFIERAKKFATKYFEGDLRKLTYCLKDVYCWKEYYDLKESFQPVDYTKLVEDRDNTRFEAEPACVAGACLV